MSENELTPRQIEILSLAVYSNPEVAHRLSISVRTVKNHWTHILERLNCFNRTQAVFVAIDRGIISLDDVERGPLRRDNWY